MPVTIARKPAPVVDAAPENVRVRDRRPDPVGPAGKRLMAAAKPSKKEIREAFDEFVPFLNRMAYYTDYSSWWGICQRHGLVLKAAEKEDGKTAKGTIRQLWQEYVRLMKEGVFERRWGHEPNGS